MTSTAPGGQLTAEQFDQVWLPYRPMAGSKTGPKDRMPRPQALQHAYIEANVADVLRSLVIVDHDGGEADRIARDLDLPPSWIAERRDGSHCGHLVYALGSPVCLTNAARRPPVNLLARIEHGMHTLFGGDPAYAGTFTKNPFHQEHLTLWGPATAIYGLRELSEALRALHALPGAGKPRQHVHSSAVGRNVALFDDTRRWAYPRRGDFHLPGRWEAAVLEYATTRNELVIAHDFDKGPLLPREVRSIARSVARWTWRNIKQSRSEWHSRKGRHSAIVRQQRSTLAVLSLDPEV